MQKALKKYFPVFVLPTMTAFIIFFLIPFILGLYLSLCDFTTVSDTRFIGIGNFQKIWGDSTFVHSLWFTALFAGASIVLINVLAFAVALFLTKQFHGTNFFRTVFFMPNLIGGIVLGYIWQLIFNGILAYYSKTLTYSAVYGFWGLLILMCWQQVGYMMIIYIAGLQSIPADLYEAARIDGATPSQRLSRITIPMSMPAITICTFLTLTNSFKLFDQNLALTAGQPSDKTEMLALNIVHTFYNRIGWEGVGQAKAVVFFFIVAILVISQLKMTRNREVQQ